MRGFYAQGQAHQARHDEQVRDSIPDLVEDEAEGTRDSAGAGDGAIEVGSTESGRQQDQGRYPPPHDQGPAAESSRQDADGRPCVG